MRSPTSSARLRLEKYRVRVGALGSDDRFGNNGVFLIPVGPESESYRACYQCIVSDGGLWEHVSVVVVSQTGFERTPIWDEMCAVKQLFWEDDEVVIQYHPAKADYVNVHPNCLHLWKPIGKKIPTPPQEMVG